MTPRLTDKAPQISVVNWVLGGSLITVPANRNKGKGHNHAITKPANMDEAKEADKKSENGDQEKHVTDSDPKPSDGGTEPTRDSSGNLIWTPDLDALLLSLKALHKTWKEILPLLQTNKKDAQARLKHLADGKGEEASGEGGDGGDDGAKGKEGKEKEKGKGKAGKGQRLKADEAWSRRDCEMLEMLEARYTEQKWLQMQAGFYNLTGRMVLSGIIEKKFQTG